MVKEKLHSMRKFAQTYIKPKDHTGQPREWTQRELDEIEFYQQMIEQGKTARVIKGRIHDRIIWV